MLRKRKGLGRPQNKPGPYITKVKDTKAALWGILVSHNNCHFHSMLCYAMPCQMCANFSSLHNADADSQVKKKSSCPCREVFADKLLRDVFVLANF